MAQTNALLFVPGLCKYHQRQSLKGNSLNPCLTTFQSKCLDYYKLFVSLSKNVLKAVSKNQEIVAKRRYVCFSLHVVQCTVTIKNTEIQKTIRKCFKASSYFSLGYMAWESSRVSMVHFYIKLDFFPPALARRIQYSIV